MTKLSDCVTLRNMEEIIKQFREFLATPAGLTYLARRVRVGAKAAVGEQLRLEAWLKERAQNVLTEMKTKEGEGID